MVSARPRSLLRYNEDVPQRIEQQLSPHLAEFLGYLRRVQPTREQESGAREEQPFFLTKITGDAGVLYEKIRSAVDNKEEHFLRRHAIRRIVARVMWFSGNPQTITRVLLRELYLGGYLPRTAVSREKEERVLHTVTAVLALSLQLHNSTDLPEFLRLKGFLLDIAAGAVEDDLYPTHNEEAAVRLLQRVTESSLETKGFSPVTSEEKNTLVYIASWRSLFAADRALLIYKLWVMAFPGWEEGDVKAGGADARVFARFVRTSERFLAHPIGKRLVPQMKNTAIAVSVLYKILMQHGAGIEALASDRMGFLDRARRTIVDEYKKYILRASRRALRATLYLLCTKALLAIAIESVYLMFLHAELNAVATTINVLFPPTLLFLLSRGIGMPSKKNTDRLVALVDAIVYGGTTPPTKVTLRTTGLMNDVALALYIAALTAMFLGIVSALQFLDFHSVDIVLFIAFLALATYFGFRVRLEARKMELSGTEEGFFLPLFELAALPVVSVGRWLVVKFERLNVIALFLDLFIETPLKLVFDFFDAFSVVLKEKKDEIYS